MRAIGKAHLYMCQHRACLCPESKAEVHDILMIWLKVSRQDKHVGWDYCRHLWRIQPATVVDLTSDAAKSHQELNSFFNIHLFILLCQVLGFPGVASGKEHTYQPRRHEIHVGSLGQEKPEGERHGNTLQYSCLECPMDRGACWATVYMVAQIWTRLKRLSTHARMH